MIQILIDADACPVKDETYRVAARYDVPVVVVSNSPIRVPATPLISRKIVSDAFDAADDWIVEHTAPRTVVITGDILLADRCLKLGAIVIAPNGKPFTYASIGNAVAVRAIMAAQLPRQQRLARADDVLLNNGDLSQLRSQVDRLHDRYLALAAAPRNPS